MTDDEFNAKYSRCQEHNRARYYCGCWRPPSLVAGAIVRSIDQAYAGYLAQLERASVPDGTVAILGPEGQEGRTPR